MCTRKDREKKRHKTTFHPCHETTSLFTFGEIRISLLAFFTTRKTIFHFHFSLLLSSLYHHQAVTRRHINSTQFSTQMVKPSAREIFVNESTGNWAWMKRILKNHQDVFVCAREMLMIINFNGLASHLSGFVLELLCCELKFEIWSPFLYSVFRFIVVSSVQWKIGIVFCFKLVHYCIRLNWNLFSWQMFAFYSKSKSQYAFPSISLSMQMTLSLFFLFDYYCNVINKDYSRPGWIKVRRSEKR